LYDKANKTTGQDLKEEVSDVVNVSKNYTVEQWDKMNRKIDEKMKKVSSEFNERMKSSNISLKTRKLNLKNEKNIYRIK